MGLSNKVVSSIETAAIEAKKCELILEYAADYDCCSPETAAEAVNKILLLVMAGRDYIEKIENILDSIDYYE